MSPIISKVSSAGIINSTSGFNVGRRRPTRLINITDNIVIDGLVLYLDAGNTASYPGSGTTWTDLSGSGNNGTLINGPTYNSSNNGSIVFDSTDDYVLVNSNTSSLPYGSSARTVSIWFYTNSSTWADNVNSLFFYGTGSPGQAFGIDFSSLPNIEFFSWGGAPSNDITFGSRYAQVGWKNITLTYDGATTLLIYENASLTQTLTFPSSRNTAVSDVYIGSYLVSSHYDGRIANVAMYNRALTSTEIRQNFNALNSRFKVYTYTGLALNKNNGLGGAANGTSIIASNGSAKPNDGGTATFDVGIPYTTLRVIYGNMSNSGLGNKDTGAVLSINGSPVVATGTYGSDGYSSSYNKYYDATNGTLNSIGIGPGVAGSHETAIYAIIIDGVKLTATGPTWS